ncbi:MAG TPA: S1C family serine protease [Phycisphaerae bacterium]|nr:S1C family serine protease [Phycisphaerae bacterium]
MRRRRTHFGVLLGILAAVGAASRSAGEPAPFNETAVQAKLAPSLCRVTVQNAWGVPLGLANGFILGNGRFVVTELGVLACPGAVQAVIRFQDGSQVATEQFGMADPVSGLAALYLKPGASSREGLALVRELPPLAAVPTVATMDSQGGSQPVLITGRLVAGPRMNELAARTGVSVLKADWTFLRITRRGTVGASGMPVLDADGAVLGVRIDVVGRSATAPLVVPATALWDALFTSKPELKPLTALPTAAWPVPSVRLEGEPPTAPQFSRLVLDLQESLVCQICDGRGTVKDTSTTGSEDSVSMYGYYAPRVTCKACGGDGVACVKEAYARLKAMAEACTCVAWAPCLGARAKKALLTQGVQRLKELAATGTRFHRDWAAAVTADLRAADDFPRGIVARAGVGETIDGPDGRYTVLEIAGFRESVIFRAGAVADLSAPGPVGIPAEPKEGTWIVVGGVAQKRLVSGKGGPASLRGRGRPVYVLPFGWVPARPAAPGGGGG